MAKKHPPIVYFIQQDRDGPIKIGTTTCFENRFAALQGANPNPLRVLVLVYGDATHERLLHAQFAKTRIVGEWFKPTPEILRVIRAIKDMSDDLPELPNLPGYAESGSLIFKRKGKGRLSGDNVEDATIEHIDRSRARTRRALRPIR